MEEKWYVLIDRQDSDFEIGIKRTRAEWKEWALKQARDSANIGLECVIMDISEDDIIEYIDKTWELTLVTKKFELALLYNDFDYECAFIKTIEFNLKEINELKQEFTHIIVNHDKDLYKIELSILEQDVNGANLTTESLCEINILALNKLLKEYELWHLGKHWTKREKII